MVIAAVFARFDHRQQRAPGGAKDGGDLVAAVIEVAGAEEVGVVGVRGEAPGLERGWKAGRGAAGPGGLPQGLPEEGEEELGELDHLASSYNPADDDVSEEPRMSTGLAQRASRTKASPNTTA